MNYFRLKSIQRVVAFFLIAIFIFSIPATAHAAWYDPSTWGISVIEWFTDDYSSQSIAQMLIGTALKFFVGVVASMVKGMSFALDWALHLGIGEPAIIQQGWQLVRNFANMFFILIMVIMAFATILDLGSLGWPGYDARTLITRFLVAALLINFSLVIGQGIIYYTNAVNNVFLTGIGQINEVIIESLDPKAVLAQVSTTGSAAGSLDRAVMAIIFGGILILGLVIGFLFSIFRIPALWFLLILSPLAWLTMVLPSTRKIHQDWWKAFIGWNFFMPIYLFFLYLGMAVVSDSTNILNSIAGAQADLDPFKTGLQLSLGRMFLYIFTGITMIGGAGIAFKSSFMAGTGAVAAANMARGAVSGTIRGAFRQTGVPGAYKQAKDYYGKEGVRIPGMGGMRLGGSKALEARQGAIAGGVFGVPGASYAQEKQFAERTNAASNTLQQQLQHGEVTEDGVIAESLQGSATDERVLARRLLAATTGRLTNEIYERTLDELKDNPAALQNFIKTAGEHKNASVDEYVLRSALMGGSYTDSAGKVHDFGYMRTAQGTSARKQLAVGMQNNPAALSKMSDVEYQNALALLGRNPGQPHSEASKGFAEAVAKSNPAVAAATEPDPAKVSAIWRNAARNATVEQLGSYSYDTWKNGGFVSELSERIGLKASAGDRREFIEDLRARLTDPNRGDKELELNNAVVAAEHTRPPTKR